MKIILIAAFSFLSFSQKKCTKSPVRTSTANCFKGRLEVKGICANYTIKLLEGKMNTQKPEASWTDERTGNTYANVFALGNPCSFPDTVNAGDEFYFMLDDSGAEKCTVCMAYYPRPETVLRIKVVSGTCK